MAFSDILADFSKQIELVAEFNYRDPATDATGKVYVSFGNTVPQTASTDTPASETFPPLLKDPGTLDYRLTEDLVFSGLPQLELGNVVLDNSGRAFDSWSNLTFGGRDYILYGGEAGAAFSTFEILARAKVRGEPQVTPSEVRIGLQSPMERLNLPIRASRYVGIPTCAKFLTTTGAYSAPYVAAYALPSFTVVIRFKVLGATANNQFLARQGNATTNQRIGLYLGSSGGGFSGRVRARSSFGGVSVEMLTSPLSYVDGKWHTAVWGLLDKTTTYLMIDQSVVATYTPTASIDAPTDALNNINLIGSLCDLRLYNAYLSPDEARAVVATRIEGTEPGVVGCWRFDDASGSTAADYSSTNNDASLSGILNTDFEWRESDLGMPEQAGLPRPAPIGFVFNQRAHLIDSARERYCWVDWESDGDAAILDAVRSRGVVLTPTTDYAEAINGVLAMVAEQDEPVTVDTEGGTMYPGTLIARLLLQRSPIPFTVQGNTMTWIDGLMPFPSGWTTDQEMQVSVAAAEILRGAGLHLQLVPTTDDFALGALLPPVAPGPYNSESVLEMMTGEVRFSNVNISGSSRSIACWFKLQQFAIDTQSTMDLVRGASGASIRFDSLGKLVYQDSALTPATLTSGALGLDYSTFYFVAGTYSNSTQTRKLYLGKLGGSVVEIASQTGITGTPTTSATANITLGLGIESHVVAHAQVWDRALSLAEVQALFAAPPVGTESGLLFYAPMNDGSGTTALAYAGGVLIASDSFASTLHRWAPKLRFDLDNAEEGSRLDFVRSAVPTWKATVGYKRNFSPMTPADVAATVTQSDLQTLIRQHLSVPAESADTLSDYLESGRLDLVSPFRDRTSAEALARNLLTRFDTSRQMALLANAHRESVALALTDEVMITSTAAGLAAGRSFRVVEKRVRFGGLRADLGLWG